MLRWDAWRLETHCIGMFRGLSHVALGCLEVGATLRWDARTFEPCCIGMLRGSGKSCTPREESQVIYQSVTVYFCGKSVSGLPLFVLGECVYSRIK